ncbi:MAG: hypothetical protein R3284_08630, partial [Rubricoccaceae bacterium]|nr:hypothetical protein [Rubricoccaceae bacterium]
VYTGIRILIYQVGNSRMKRLFDRTSRLLRKKVQRVQRVLHILATDYIRNNPHLARRTSYVTLSGASLHGSSYCVRAVPKHSHDG